ncbi:GNAT family N-acetyltransferase [Mesorhizobium sp. M1338]|uniref:hypothetical protein n=1 Tax=unclassified Mesorhizobium TaxID=325217 RepID=UPI0033365A4D
MPRISLDHRLATRADMPALAVLMNAAIGELQKPFLTEEQIISSRAILGLDTQLVDDGTYFIVEQNGILAGCGGWSRRATLYGGDRSPGRDAALLDPTKDAARVRAMYTHPSFIRRGVGRLILTLWRMPPAARASQVSSLWQQWPANRSIGPAALRRLKKSSTTEAERACHCCG